MKLCSPAIDYRKAFLDMALDNRRSGEDRYQIENIEEPDVFESYIAMMLDHSQGRNLKPGRVPNSTFWMMDNNIIYGVSRFRHFLNEYLLAEAGHIGYDVPPSQRRKGYGTYLLKLTLEKAASIGLERVLVTCDSDNIGSQRIILNNGGILENEVEHDGNIVCRYWIDIKGLSSD
jgi:predicted acetyltransferase